MTKSASRGKNALIIQLRLLMRSCPKVPEQSAPPTVGCLRQHEESSTMIISFSLHNSCSNKMCQVILTKPLRAPLILVRKTQPFAVCSCPALMLCTFRSPVLSKSCAFFLLLIVVISDDVQVCRLIYQSLFKENFNHQPYLVVKFDLQ